MKYIKFILTKAWKKREKIIKFYKELSNQQIHYISIVALKTIYLLHQYFLNGPPEVLTQDNFNVDEFITDLNGVWAKRCELNDYDEEDLMKNELVSKVIINSTDFLYKKLCFLKKFPFIENNYSLEDTILNFNYFDYNSLIEKAFIKELLLLYSQSLDLFLNVPISITQLSLILDTYLQVLNEEIIYIFTLLFLVIVSFKNSHSKNKKDEITSMFDEKFIEISVKFNEGIEIFKNFRLENHSRFYFLEIPNNFSLYLKNLNNNLKIYPSFEFNIKSYFMQILSKDIIGIKMHHSMSKLIELDLFEFPEKYIHKIENVLEVDDNGEPSKVNSSVVNGQNFYSLGSLCPDYKSHSNSVSDNELEKSKQQNYSTINHPNSSNLQDKANNSRFDFNEDKFNQSFTNFNFDEIKHKNNGRSNVDKDKDYNMLRGKLAQKSDNMILYNNYKNTENYNDKNIRVNKLDDKKKPSYKE